MDEYLKFVRSLAFDCGKIISDAYALPSVSYETKCSVADLVSDVDRQVEEETKKRIAQQYPDHKFLAEESISSGSNCVLTEAPTFILDPIDGTANFINRFPFCCYSLGFYVKKEAEVAVIYNPIMKDLFYAIRGKGAFHNDQPIRVSTNSDLKSALVLSDWGSDREPELVTLRSDNLKNIIMNCRGIRSMGSAALHMCLVASGAADVYFEYGIHCWDVAAGKLIVEEAGGSCTMVNGSPLQIMEREVLACGNPQLIPQLSKLIQYVPYPADK